MTECGVHDCTNDADDESTGLCDECVGLFMADAIGPVHSSAFLAPEPDPSRRVPKKLSLDRIDMDNRDDWYK